MPLLCADDNKITNLTRQIVLDFLIYSHCPESLKHYGYTDEAVISDCTFRQKVHTHIMKLECELALQIIKDHSVYKKNEELVDIMHKQLFIESVYKKDYTKAIEIASEYMENGKNDKDIFSILGYKNDANMIEQLCGDQRRAECCEKVNEMMITIMNGVKNGTKKSLLWYLCNQQKSILHYSK